MLLQSSLPGENAATLPVGNISAEGACPLCLAEGKNLYKGLPDRLFGAQGAWTLSKCRNRQCGIVWVDPAPDAETIRKSYETYYTHTSNTASRTGLAHRLYRFVRDSYLGI